MLDRLYLITSDSSSLSHLEQVEAFCQGGAKLVQFRTKQEFEAEELKKCLEVCKNSGAKLIVNDHCDLALEIGAHGVHLGREDEDIASAREKLGEEALVGATINSLRDISPVTIKHADYLGVGPYKPTTTKESANPPLGEEGMSALLECIQAVASTPSFAIGGIQIEDVKSLRKLGFWGVAVSSAAAEATDPSAEVGKLLEEV